MNINCVISPIKPHRLKQFSFCERIRNHVRSGGWPYGAGMSSSVSEQGPRESASGNPSHDSTVQKHPRSSPTLLTPRRHQKQILFRKLVVSDDRTVASLVPTTLTYETEGGRNDGPTKSKEQWLVNELKALNEFVLIHTSGESWPTHKQDGFGKVPVNL